MRLAAVKHADSRMRVTPHLILSRTWIVPVPDQSAQTTLGPGGHSTAIAPVGGIHFFGGRLAAIRSSVAPDLESNVREIRVLSALHKNQHPNYELAHHRANHCSSDS